MRTWRKAPIRRSLYAVLVVLLAACAFLLATQTLAAASIDPDCSASVTIDGVEYGPHNDTPANPIVIPDKEGLVASWRASTDSPITNYSGKIGVVIGPATATIEDWQGENADEKTSAEGEYAIDTARDTIRDKATFDLVGIHVVKGEHSGEGGSCSGTAMVKIEGNPLASPIGAGAAAGTVLTAGGLAGAAFAKRPR